MTKGFLHGRTEAIRTVQLDSVAFTKVCAYFLVASFPLLVVIVLTLFSYRHSSQNSPLRSKRFQRCGVHVKLM